MLDIAQDVRVDRLAAGVPGERPAVVSAGGALSYAEFDAAVNHIAGVLRAKGVERDECVAVIVPRSPELVVAIHGILRAGAAYVPIDPEYPALRIRTIIEGSGARVIVAGTEFAETADELGVDRVEPSTAGADPIEPVASPEDLAYVIYTSGSTGRTQGRDGRAPVGGQPAALDAAAVSTRCRRRDSAEDAGDIRCLGVGVDVVGDGGCERCIARAGWPAGSAQDHRRGRAVSGDGHAFRAVDAWPVLGSIGGPT